MGDRVGARGVGQWLLISVLGLSGVACAPSAIRTGPTIALPNGNALNACERAEWYEPAPAKLDTQAQTAGVIFNTIHVGHFEGVAVFKTADGKPQELEDVWPRLNEPRLQQLHEARIQTVDDANNRAVYWALGGLGGMVVGLGGAAAVADSNKDAAIGLGVGGLVAGLVGVVGALIAQPSGEEQLGAEARRKLFLEGEDDMTAVRRGVDRANASARTRCGGRPTAPTPAPAAPAPAPAAPAPAPAAPAAPAPAPAAASAPASNEPGWSEPAPAAPAAPVR